MNHYNIVEYKAKGIPDKLIEEATKILNVTIKSSSNNPEFQVFPNEFRTDSATKVWKRLVAKNQAAYDERMDIYTYNEI